MIKIDYASPLPFISELKKGCSDTELEDAIGKLELNPLKDEDLRLWFGLQRVIRNLSSEGAVQGVPPIKEIPSGEIIRMGMNRRILRDYWVPRKEWNLVELAGGYQKLNRNVGGFGFELIRKHWTPKSKTAILHSCSGVKPYHSSPTYQHLISSLVGYSCDLIVLSYTNLLPIEVDEQYPFAFYQGTMWNPEKVWEPYRVTEFFDYFNQFENALFYIRPDNYDGKGGKYPRVYKMIDSGEYKFPAGTFVYHYWKEYEEVKKIKKYANIPFQIYCNRYYSMNDSEFLSGVVEKYCSKEKILDEGELF